MRFLFTLLQLELDRLSTLSDKFEHFSSEWGFSPWVVNPFHDRPGRRSFFAPTFTITAQKEDYTMDFCTSFTCPARYCELLSTDLVSGASFIEKLISQVLNSDPLNKFSILAVINLSITETIYLVNIHVKCDFYPNEIANSKETFILIIKAVISQILRQCFWKVRYSES